VLRLRPDVLLCHGTPRSDLEYFLETLDADGLLLARADEIEARLDGQDAALVACGHTHLPRAVRTRRGQLIVNPGSVGLPAYEDTHPIPHRVETGSPDARYAIVETSPTGWVATLLAVPYDFSPMAELARRHGRADWESALSSGYLS
jgi:predicted phosphodiesterase